MADFVRGKGDPKVDATEEATVNALSFECKRAQHEFDLGKLVSKTPLFGIQFMMMRFGPKLFMVDARFAEAIQPTRSLGDAHMTNKYGVIRAPMMMWVPLPAPPPAEPADAKYVFLCSDGMFSENAFTSMADVAQCVTDPLMWFRRSFYQADNMLSERLMFARRLDPKDAPLTKAWRACGASWGDVVRFLCETHWAEVQSDAFLATFSSQTATASLPLPLPGAPAITLSKRAVNASHLAWLHAAADSLAWLRDNTRDKPAPSLRNHPDNLHFLAETLIHLGVVRGSHDNTTCALARCPNGR